MVLLYINGDSLELNSIYNNRLKSKQLVLVPRPYLTFYKYVYCFLGPIKQNSTLKILQLLKLYVFCNTFKIQAFGHCKYRFYFKLPWLRQCHDFCFVHVALVSYWKQGYFDGFCKFTILVFLFN